MSFDSQGPCRDLQGARAAYRTQDPEASRIAHQRRLRSPQGPGTSGRLSEVPNDLSQYFIGPHNEAHLDTSGEYVKAFVFGGLDGIVTIFAVIAGCVGADISASQIIIVGIGNLMADAFSMGFGEYVSSKAEEQYVEGEKAREQWELDNYPEGEKEEMKDIYTMRYGFTSEDAQAMIDITFKYPKFFLQHMMVEELGLKIESESVDDDAPTPLKRGLIMFVSFGCFGMVPLLGFAGYLFMYRLLNPNKIANTSEGFIATCTITLCTLFILGVFKSRFSNEKKLASGLIMMANGAVASVVAFGSGVLLKSILISS